MLQAQLLNRVEQRLRGMNLPVNIEFWNGKRVRLGNFPKVNVVLRRPAALKALAQPGLGKIGRAYVEGDIDIDCDIQDLVAFADSLCGPRQVDLKKRDSDDWKWWWHTRVFDRRAINHHYDVSNEFFALWLDRQRVYSCAYFRKPDDSLDLAQQQKIDHICRKLNLQSGERILDIGCGWGALILRAAEQYGAHATGITLSEQQFAYVQEQISARNRLPRRARGPAVRQDRERRHV